MKMMFCCLLTLIIFCVFLFLYVFRDRRPSIERWTVNALESGDTNYLREYLNSGHDVNDMIRLGPHEYDGVPLLDGAIYSGQWASVNYLLKHGADPNRRDMRGYTPLRWAIRRMSGEVPQHKSISIVKLLLESGADPNLSVSLETLDTPLQYAAFIGKNEIVTLLLSLGVNVNATNRSGQSALHFAANAEIAKMLISSGASTGIVTITGKTPFESARGFGRFEVLRVLTNAP